MKLSCKRYQTWLFSNNNFGSNVECLLWNTHFKTPLELIRIFFLLFSDRLIRGNLFTFYLLNQKGNSDFLPLHEWIIHEFLPAWKKDLIIIFHQRNILGKKVSQRKSAYSFCLVFSKLESLLLKIGVSKPLNFLHHGFNAYIETSFYIKEMFKNISNLTRQNIRGICEEKCTICIKKNLIWLSRFYFIVSF